MEAAGVTELEPIERPHRDRHLMEIAKDWSGSKKVIGNHRYAQASIASGKGIGQRRDEDAVLAFPV